ncbi:MAG: multiple monosaccharide ABC transporter permease [Candidatus Limivicinus sp.]|jgi:putative multiple sugar transport system permease protein
MSKSKVMNWVQKYTMLLILILVVAFFTWQTDGKLLLPQNITNIISQNAYVFVLATGMLLCILTGGNIDLSVGSVVCFVGAVGAILMSKGLNMWLAVLAMLVLGLAIGAWQAFWIAFVRVPPFIVTLAGMFVFRGLSNVVLNGKTLSVTNEAFVRIFGGGAKCYVPDIFGGTNLNILCLVAGIIAALLYLIMVIHNRRVRVKKGYEVESRTQMIARTFVILAVIIFFAVKQSQYKGIPTALIWVVLVVLVYGYVTSKTTVGRHLYAVGGNEKATKLSGINTNKVYFFAYANMGLLAALAGMLTIARMTSAQPTYGQNYEMDAIGSCFIGGASAYGGTGTVGGVIVGAVLMGVINIGMSIMGIDQNYQKVVKGLVLLGAVIFDVVSKRQKN